ncbi:hypothetical protein D3C79_897320 [compost metagenome]
MLRLRENRLQAGGYVRVLHRVAAVSGASASRIVAEFNDADIGIRLGGILGKSDFVKGGFKLVQRFQAFPQKHHHEISLLADDSIYCRASFLCFLHRTPFLHKGMKFLQGNGAFLVIGSCPGCPVQ